MLTSSKDNSIFSVCSTRHGYDVYSTFEQPYMSIEQFYLSYKGLALGFGFEM